MKRMKRLARYLLEVPEGIIRYDGWVEKLDKLQTYVDSDSAGCKKTRASTSGGAMTWRTNEIVELNPRVQSIILRRSRVLCRDQRRGREPWNAIAVSGLRSNRDDRSYNR